MNLDDSRYHALFDAGPPALELDHDLNVLAISRRARELLGDRLGGGFLEAVRAGDRALFREAVAPLVEGLRADGDVQVRAIGADGAEVVVDVCLSAASPGRLLAVLAPSRADGHLALLARTSQHLVFDDARAEAVHAVFADVAATLGFEIFVHFVVDDPTTLRLAAWGGIEQWQRDALARLPFGEALCGRVAAAREPMVLEDLGRTALAEVAAATIPGARCFVGVPLVAQGQLLGTVSFATRARERHRRGDLQVIRAVCDQAALHLARAASERLLRERDLFFQLAIYSNLVTLCDWDVVNDRVRRLHSAEEALPPTPDGSARYADILRIVHPDDRAQFEANIAQALASPDGKFRTEYRIVRDDGEVRWLAENGQVEYDAERRPVRLVCVSLDVTERTLAREELRERDQHLRIALRAGHLGTWDWDLRTGRVRLDEWAAASLGFPPGHTMVSAHELTAHLHPDDVERMFGALKDHFDGKTALFEFEHRAVRTDGTVLWLFNRGQVVQRDAAGDAIRAIGTYTDVTASRLDADARRDAERRLATVLEASPLGFGLFDRDLRYVQINDALARMNGVPAAELLGRRPREALGERGGDLVESKVRRVFETGAALVDDDVVLQRDDRAYACITQYLPVLVEDEISAVCCVVTDVSSLKRAEARARASEEALAAEARRKDEFLAMLAHELRNPLAPIRNAVHLIGRAPKLDERVLRRASSIIERQIAHLVRLVDDLLDVSRVSRGKITLQKAPVDLRDIARRAVETNHNLLDQRRHRLALTLPDHPVVVDGDATRLVQVLDNLVNNAAKYTDEGGSIEVVVERGADGAVARVRDNGRGIDPAAIPSLFDLFYQADRNLDRSEGGLGIGLSLVKSLVELHQGKVVAESEGRGRGSTFTVTLPAAPPDARPAHSSIPPGGSGRPLQVLLVDDLPDTVESLALLLRLDGHAVVTAADGQAAIDRALELRPDVVLLDIGLPRVNGYDACRAMRDAGLRDTWIAALSGYGQESDRERSAEAGFDAHLVKPVDLELLRRLLAERAQIPMPAPTPQ